MNKDFYAYYRIMIFTAILPYLILFIPSRIAGFNLTGWSWVIMLLASIYYIIKLYAKKTFPVLFWLPWIILIAVYIVFDFTWAGLQLTFQYLLPVLVGIVASSFVYDNEKMNWLFKQILLLTAAIIAIYLYSIYFMDGMTPNTAATPMLLSIAAALSIGVMYITNKVRYLILFGLLFLVPLLEVTRMGILVFVVIYMLHFANKKILYKSVAIASGAALILIVFNTDAVQEKMFKEGKGNITDLSFDYYNSEFMNTSGRSTFIEYYERGISESPIWGNGPRSDLNLLKDELGAESAVEVCNDYVAVRYYYGNVGLAALLLGFVCTYISVYRNFRKENNPYRYLIHSTVMILTITFLMFMYTDNILKYTIFFPNIYFALIGMSYAKYEEVNPIT
jgi:hypothetical protein